MRTGSKIKLIFNLFKIGIFASLLPLIGGDMILGWGTVDMSLDGMEQYFLIPVTVIFFVFFLVMNIVQIMAFAKGHTPYPRWCWIFTIGAGDDLCDFKMELM